ncbi:hypothetical protein NUH16_003356 [Penicillium rubens]|nr:hypothetical protein NUH16_003356 [Penicillium rubens]
MSPRSEIVWSEWEEKNLHSWLDAHRELPWKARSDAYYEQYRVVRSVGSLRGKMYHILRKQRRTGAKVPKHPGNRNQAGAARRSVGGRASLETLPKQRPAQSNIAKWFQTILTAEPSHTDTIESTKAKGSSLGMSWSSFTVTSKLIIHIRPRDATTQPFAA